MSEIKIKKSIEDLQVGDKVFIRSDLVSEEYYNNLYFAEEMKFYCEEQVTVREIENSCLFGHIFYPKEADNYGDNDWSFSNDMIDWDKTNGYGKREDGLQIEFDKEYESQFFDLEVKFAKINEDAKIPTKNDEDAGFDLYASFEEDYIEIKPHTMKLIPTGIKSSYPKEHMALIKERGSTGTKCMSVRAGVMDSGFRNEWKVVLNNTSDKTVYIVKDHENFSTKYAHGQIIIYPYSKAIAQFLFIPVPKVKVTEVSIEEIDNDESIRGLGMLGSSGK